MALLCDMRTRAFLPLLTVVCLAAGAAFAQPAASIGDPKYLLRTGDRLNYRIAEDPIRASSPMQVAINSVGEANFAVSRGSDIRITVEVRGKTVAEVRDELTRRLLADYYHKATLEIALAEKVLTPGKVQFFGEMTGEITLLPDTPPLMLSDAVLRVGGGRAEFANLRRIKVHRVDPTTGQNQVITVDVKSILEDGKRERDILLQDGDRIEVPQKWIQ